MVHHHSWLYSILPTLEFDKALFTQHPHVNSSDTRMFMFASEVIINSGSTENIYTYNILYLWSLLLLCIIIFFILAFICFSKLSGWFSFSFVLELLEMFPWSLFEKGLFISSREKVLWEPQSRSSVRYWIFIFLITHGIFK